MNNLKFVSFSSFFIVFIVMSVKLLLSVKCNLIERKQ